jgi:hypothetical protein
MVPKNDNRKKIKHPRILSVFMFLQPSEKSNDSKYFFHESRFILVLSYILRLFKSLRNKYKFGVKIHMIDVALQVTKCRE